MEIEWGGSRGRETNRDREKEKVAEENGAGRGSRKPSVWQRLGLLLPLLRAGLPGSSRWVPARGGGCCAAAPVLQAPFTSVLQ